MKLQNVQALKKGAIGVGSVVAGMGLAHAETASVDGLFTSIATDLAGVATGILAVLAALGIAHAILVGWSYVRRTR